jgi:hypothetical protein
MEPMSKIDKKAAGQRTGTEIEIESQTFQTTRVTSCRIVSCVLWYERGRRAGRVCDTRMHGPVLLSALPVLRRVQLRHARLSSAPRVLARTATPHTPATL